MYEEEDFEDAKRKYELNKKYSTNKEQEKKIKNPVSKGSLRSQNKKILRRYINNYTGSVHFDDDSFDESDFD